MRRLIFLFAILIPVTTIAQTFLDTRGHPHAAFIETLAQKSIVEGYGYGIFRPDISINRAEFLKILMLAVFGKEELQGAGECFVDFKGEVQWFWVHGCIAKQRGIINGYPDGTFRGNQTVNLAEALKIAIEAYQIDVPAYVNTPEYWYLPYFAIAGERGLFDYFPRKGDHLLTRSDMAYLIVKLGEPLADASQVIAAVPRGNINPPIGNPNPQAPNPNQGGVCGNGVLESGEQCDDGNLTDGDGCSSICAIVTQPVRHAALRVEERPTAVSPASAGAKGIALMTFDVMAGRQDVFLNTFKFAARQGDTRDATNYQLYVDLDLDGTVDAPVAVGQEADGIITFGGMQIPLQDGVPMRLQVRADLTTNASNSSFALGFAESDPRFVTAVGQEDGRELTGIELNGGECQEQSICWIGVFTLSSPPPVDIVTRGNLFISAASTPIRNHQLLGSTVTDDLLSLVFRAEGEQISVKELQFRGVPDTIEELQLFLPGISSPTATARAAQCTLQVTDAYCARTSLLIDADDEVTYNLRARMKSDQQGGKSGESVQISLSNTSMTVEAVGFSAQENLVQNDGDTAKEGEIFIGTNVVGPDQTIVSAEHDTVLARISSVQSTNPDADNSPVPTGTHIVGRFRFAADAHENANGGFNKATVQSLTFDLNATNVQIFPDSVRLLNVLDPTTASNCTTSGNTGNITVTCDSLVQSAVSTSINPGSSIELGLQMTILNAKIEDTSSTLQVSLPNLGDRTNPGTVVWDDAVKTFGWVDVDEPVVRSTLYRQ